MPAPGTSAAPSGSVSVTPRSRAPPTMEAASTCGETCSSEAASGEHLVRRAVRRRDDVGQARPARRQRAGLVEEHDPGPGERLEGAAALDDDAALRASG